MCNITININGGNNQIIPNATEAKQYFFGIQHAEKVLQEETPTELHDPALEKLALYINKESLPTYIAQLGACESATELAKVVVSMVQQDSKLTPEEIVKERFIKLLLPFAPKLTKGKGIDNLRARINDAWSTRPKPIHKHS